MKRVKVVYNRCYGGYSLSDEAVDWLLKQNCVEDPPRHDPMLVECVETLGGVANGRLASLAVRELKGRSYRLEDDDGFETVVEPEDLGWIEVE